MNVQVVLRIRPIRPMVKTEHFHCLYKGSNPLWVNSFYKRGFSLIGRIAILHIDGLGSIPKFSIKIGTLV